MMKSLISRWLSVALTGCLSLLAYGDQNSQINAALSPAQIGYIDGAVEALRQRDHVPGLSLAVFSSKGNALVKAYGYSDKDGQVPLQVDDTIPIASISKTFVAVALMRAQEMGLLSLDDDANRHLDFTLPTYPGSRAITLRDLARHEAGFEERWLATGAGFAEDSRSWGEQLAQTYPQLIAPPGTYASYSNYGIALLGYVIERAAGVPYHEFLRTQVLEPLGMYGTTAEHPEPGAFAEKLVPGLYVKDGVIRAPKPTYNLRTYPAGRVLSTLPDMAKFGRMILSGGVADDGVRLLSRTSVDTMIADTRAAHESIPGIAIIFAEKDIAGIRFVGHGGDGGTHHTDLILSREHDLGIYMGFLSAPGPQAREFLARTLVPKLVAGSGFEPVAFEQGDKATDKSLAQYAGQYRHYRWAFTSVERTLQLVSEFAVKDSGTGSLIVKGRLGAGEYLPTKETGLFQNRLTGELMYFWRGEDGQLNMNMGSFPFVTAFKLSTADTQGFNQFAFFGMVIIFIVLTLILISLMVSNYRKGNGKQALGLALLTLASGLSAYGMMGFMLAASSTPEQVLQQSIPGFAYWYLTIPFIVFGLVALYLLGAFKRTWLPQGWLTSITSLSTVVFVGLLMLYLNHWNALGWNFP
ncbi:beta-lactamase family protein [Pseudomaricurvus alkylphenolicus]|uniref:serine hydrolase domain-containing protein n=1 Tax=Pseudomaricurvus alkylphenolicus TaxID=1306991 RepID=UPI00141E2099|nr:serine hydrolase domain-containing protein [Pseudomaricurvus alkylphenolicus]NIB40603.1 beta-lactamase family protein [Pseudomaricurvus alkylphenolicus]